MISRVAQDRVHVRQIYRLLQCVHREDRVQIEKLVTLGFKGLINLTEPEDGIGVLHVAVLDNNLGEAGPLLQLSDWILENVYNICVIYM